MPTPLVRQVFRRWHRTTPSPEALFWSAEFDPELYACVDAVAAQIRLCLALDDGCADAREDVALAMLEDCWSLADTGERGSVQWQAGCLLVALTVGCHAKQYLYQGELRPTYDWLVRALDRGNGRHIGYLIALTSGEIVVRPLHRELHDSFTYALYTCDRYLHSLEEVTTRWFDELSLSIANELLSHPELSYLACALVDWCQERAIHQPSGLEAVVLLRSIRQASDRKLLPTDLDTEFEILDIISVMQSEPDESVQRIDDLLERRASEIRGTHLLTALSLRARTEPEMTVRWFADLAHTIDRVMDEDWSQTTDDYLRMADRRGTHWPKIANFAKALLEQGRPDLIGPLLGAWLRVEHQHRRADLLVWSISNVVGTGWASERRVSTSGAVDLRQITSEADQFLGRSFAARPGVPVPSKGPTLERSLRQAIDSDRLANVVASCRIRPAALLLMPHLGISPQPIMIDEVGWSLPWSVSLEAPSPDRVLRKALVLCIAAGIGEMEGRAVSSYLRSAGVEVESVTTESISSETFGAAFADSSFDLVWLIGHGEFDPTDPRRAGIHLGRGQMSAGSLRDLTPNTHGCRRLLVLNLCDSASVVNSGGVPEYGLASMAAQRHQAVIGHAWPVVSWPDAAIFGRLLANRLVTLGEFYPAFEDSVKLMRAPLPRMLDFLRQSASAEDESLERALLEQHGDRIGREFASWGSPCFLE